VRCPIIEQKEGSGKALVFKQRAAVITEIQSLDVFGVHTLSERSAQDVKSRSDLKSKLENRDY
jgi:hypothetical protein